MHGDLELHLSVEANSQEVEMPQTMRDRIALHFADQDQLGRILTEKKSIQISLEGHNDKSGNEAYNRELFYERAESAKEYLVGKYLIEPSRIQIPGYGVERSEEQIDPLRASNRQIEVIKIAE